MSGEKNLNRVTAQAGKITFELHTLGWEAFQNLCGHVAREILGQTVTVFSPTNDAGQDGAFQGSWLRTEKEVFSGRFVIQCKFTARRDEHLSLSDLKEELAKAEKLADNGLLQTYLLMTNAKVSGESDNSIREAFRKIKGIEHFELFGSEWITEQILESKRLRAFVPRIYGLGDLSQILDERVYRQTDEILQTWRDNLAKFVPTEAHHRSVKALFDEGFVLLLGEPMAGKSTIAAALAIAAADQWKCIPVFASHPDEFKNHWNPDEPNQFFWVDDAFGQTQFDPALADGWSRLFPHLTAAIQKGARFLFTSRNYIYQAAKRELKESTFPLIKNSHVLIEVENLKLQEKERILYNHLRLGNQPAEFRRQIKAFLPAIAASPKFFPEVARRLGNPFFTKSLKMHPDQIKQFVEEPREFLAEVIEQLDRLNYAALALLFMRAGQAGIPLEIEGDEMKAMSQLGADLAQLREALLTLEGSLVAQVFEAGEHAWKFRHPSIRDAMATHVAARPDLIDIYLGGVKARELLKEVVCGDVEIEGAKVHVPRNRYAAVVQKIRGLDVADWNTKYDLLGFLTRRCSLEFLTLWFAASQADFSQIVRSCSATLNYLFCDLIVRLHQSGCLPEADRRKFVEEAMKQMVERANSIIVWNDEVKDLLTPEELQSVLEIIKTELIPAFESIVDDAAAEYDDIDSDTGEHFQNLSSEFEGFRDYFVDSGDEETAQEFERGQRLIENAVQRLEDWKQREKEKKRKEEEREQEEAEQNEQWNAEEYAWLSAEYERDQRGTRSRGASMSASPTFAVNSPLRSLFDDVDL